MSTVIQRTTNASSASIRDLFLFFMSAIYLFAFGSLYYQVPGLYGDNGILPAKLVLKGGSSNLQRDVLAKPTLVWFGPALGLDIQSMVELVALAGVLLSFVCMMFRKLRDTVCFFGLWVFYMSLYQIGQTFMWFQWDALLLEVGFLTVLIAPLNLFKWRPIKHYVHDAINLWLVKWLLFRFMFASGVVKLTSMCPTWWQLSALNYHFESQCIPTPLAWYAHHLPDWILQLGVVITFLIEIPIPFLFFSPIRSLRMFSFYCQVFFQILIILSGNYNFFNLLTLVMCLSLLDDKWLGKKSKNRRDSSMMRWSSSLMELVVLLALAYFSVKLFSMKLGANYVIESKIAFKGSDLHRFVERAVQASIYVGATSFAMVVVSAFYKTLTQFKGLFNKVTGLLGCALFASVAFWVFCISMVPHTSLDPDINAQLWPTIERWQRNVDKYQLVSSYGLFRRMTGVGGRPEIIVEGSHSMTDGWKEYHFQYKPGNLSTMPPFVAPHQPRLDWQMWFAALSSYQQNPWFVSLVNRLLSGQQEVLDLLDKDRNPFPDKPPKYIRAVLYLYHYTNPKSKNVGNWWTRKKSGEYLPAIAKDSPPLLNYLKTHGLSGVDSEKKTTAENKFLPNVLNIHRKYVSMVTAPVFLWSLFGVGVLANLVTGGSQRR